jgi:hypothetical protein
VADGGQTSVPCRLSPSVVRVAGLRTAGSATRALDVRAKRVAGGGPDIPLCAMAGVLATAWPCLWWRGLRWPSPPGRAGWLGGSGSQRTRWDEDARQPVVQGRSFSGLSITQRVCFFLSQLRVPLRSSFR